jgi:hypothetical protein
MEVRINIIFSILIFAIIHCSNPITEPHLLPIKNDNDNDYLNDNIEYYFGLDSLNPDTDDDSILDGVQLAKDFYEKIGYLPRYENEHTPYVIDEIIYGQEMCPVCDRAVNLGRVRIINPINSLADTIPFIGLHYLYYGSFRYRGEIHEGDIEPVKLGRILRLITDDK